MKRPIGHVAARASWCHARARVADLLDEGLTENEQRIASLLAPLVELTPAAALDGDELARAWILRLAYRHAQRGQA